jgi:hypothetical protein
MLQSPPALHDSPCRSVALLRQKKQLPARAPEINSSQVTDPTLRASQGGHGVGPLPLAERLACTPILVWARFPDAQCHRREARL